MKIALIIINYNGEFFLKKYLKFFEIISNNSNIDLIVTDDRSTDGSIKILKKINCKLTINNGNKGFAANVNNGINYAKKINEFDYFIIANNDIILNLDFKFIFFDIIKHINSNFDDVGLIGFKEITNSTISEINYSKYSLNQAVEVKEIPGFLFVLNEKVIKKIGLFDEEYFMYGEDNDYFFRVLNSGFRIINSNYPVLHLSEGSSSSSSHNSFLAYRNSLLFAQKNLSLFNFIKILLSLIWVIYKPVNFNRSPSVLRLRRSGFLKNNILLFRSLVWNYKYFKNINR